MVVNLSLKSLDSKKIFELLRITFSNSFSLQLIILHLIVYALELVLFTVLLFAGLGIGFVLFLLAAALSLVGPIALIVPLILGVIAFLVLLLIYLFLSAFISGIKINGVNEFLKKGKFNLKEVFEKAKPRAIKLFFVRALIMAVLGLIFGGVSLAGVVLLLVIGALGGSSSGAIFGLLLILFLLVLLVLVMVAIWTSFLVSPFFIILEPQILLENTSVKESIKRIIELGKKNYLFNLVVSLFLIIFIVGIMQFVQSIFLILIIIPYIGILIILMLMIPVGIYSSILSSIASVKIYLENTKTK